MSDVTIPEDIRVKAEKLANDVGAGLALGSAEMIARAILAERERCAKIVEGIQGPPHPLSNARTERVCRQIAQAIRSSHE